MLQRLEAPDRLAELLARLEVVDGQVEGGRHHAQQLRCDCDEREIVEREVVGPCGCLGAVEVEAAERPPVDRGAQ